MSYHDRKLLGDIFREQCERFFESPGCNCQPWGDAKTLLDGVTWQQRKELPEDIRFMPDLLIKKKSFLFGIDAKTGTRRVYPTIQREAFEAYLRLDIRAIPVYVMTDKTLFIDKGKWRRSIGMKRVSKIEFIDSEQIVCKFSLRFPIDEDGWICPPRGTSCSSGTRYKAISTKNFVQIMPRDNWLQDFGSSTYPRKDNA